VKIIAFTDIHGSYKRVDEILRSESGYDVIVVGGDLTTVGSPREAEDAITLFRSHGKPVVAVAGNMDPPVLDQTFAELDISINGRGVVLDNVGFFGVSASPLSPLRTPYEITEEEIKRRAEAGWKDVQHAAWKVFVPHAPPKDTSLDKIRIGMHVGSIAVRKFVEEYQPHVVICGHIHEARGKDILGKTVIVNCGPAGKGSYVWIELGDTTSVENRG